ncbi:alpha-L-fucosidase [Parasediminibacterium sp. JCM 36343]|uniref:alpha-L-fucosidase n=1 Tax=Parasediminibacterium sp. JCM 36343 TaxID=3374279 RepID=UPI00397B14E3
MKRIISILIVIIALQMSNVLSAQSVPLTYEQKMKEWNESKFGMFIHWGLYAIPAKGEWYMRQSKTSVAEYAKLAAQFNPTQFNADEWASIAKNSGMKYLVITSKHHDGFAMFDSKVTDYTIVKATPFKRDVVKELSIACKKAGIKFGIYYSTIADWHHPGGQAGCPHWDSAQNGNLDDYMKTVAVPQVRELATEYGPIYEFWFDNDGSKGITPALAQPIHDILKQFQPNVIEDSRLAGGDFQSQEQNISPFAPKGYWEACVTTTGGWGYTNKPAKPTSEILKMIIDISSKAGNILLNVGPDAQGLIPADNVDRLKAVGSWLAKNGESIYGSDRGPFDYLPWGENTRKGNTLYLHVYDWPKDGLLKLKLTNKVTKAYLLADNKQKIGIKAIGEKLTLQLPAIAPDSIASVIALEVEGDIKRVTSLATDKPVSTSCTEDKARLVKNVVDDNPGSEWRSKDSTGWLEINLQAEQSIGSVRVGAFTNMPEKFSLQYKQGDNWVTIFNDTDMPRNEYVKTFAPIKAQYVRLVINKIKGNGGISLRSFELFPPMD